MSLRSSVAGAISFAHLAGFGRSTKAAKPRADEDPSDETEEEKQKRKDQQREDEDDAKDDRRDDEDDEDDKRRKREDQDDADEEDDGKGMSEGDDDDDKKPSGKSGKGMSSARATTDAAYRRGQRAERERCSAIFGSAHASKNIPLAASLAFKTGMSAKAAIGVLKDTPASAAAQAPQEKGPANRRNPNLGAGGASETTQGTALAGWDRAFKRVQGRS